jgi:hypothetical protein
MENQLPVTQTVRQPVVATARLMVVPANSAMMAAQLMAMDVRHPA